jgi:hypothetical protein
VEVITEAALAAGLQQLAVEEAHSRAEQVEILAAVGVVARNTFMPAAKVDGAGGAARILLRHARLQGIPAIHVGAIPSISIPHKTRIFHFLMWRQ